MKQETSSSFSPDSRFLVVIILLLAGISMVNISLMPPFQGPDEIQHFLYSASYAYSKPDMEKVEARVLQILKDYKWFHFVGIGPGWENTKQISDIPFVFHFDREKQSTRKTAFHFFYGKVLKLSGIKDVLTAFYLMRIISGMIYICIFLLAYYFFKTHFPGQWKYLIAGLLVIFQLGTILNAVNYDVFLVLFGTLFFIFSFRYLYFGKKRDLFVLGLSAIAAVFIKLIGFMFIVYLAILLLMRTILFKRDRDAQWKPKRMGYVVLGALLFVIAFSWMNYLFPGRFFQLYSQLFRGITDFFSSVNSQGGEKILSADFFNSILDSFYFCTGWMGFKLSGAWYIIIRIFLIISAVGLGLIAFSRKTREAVTEKKWLLYTFIVFILHLLSIWLYYGHGTYSQGRYVYPIVLPIVFIIYAGLGAIEKKFQWSVPYLKTGFILFQVVLWVFAISRIISVFYLEMSSPHVGL